MKKEDNAIGRTLFRSELGRIITTAGFRQPLIRLLRRNPDMSRKTYAFRRAALNAIEAYRFEATEFAGVPGFGSLKALLEATLDRVDAKYNLWVELGVGSAASTKLICEVAARRGHQMTLHGFDSFQGLPEPWEEIAAKGAFAYRRPVLREKNVRLHAGWFVDTIPAFAAELAGRDAEQIGFVHVDCDIYSSTKTALDGLAPWLRAGTVLLFDEYWNYLEAPAHEIRAFRELVELTRLNFTYIGYNRNNMQAAAILCNGQPDFSVEGRSHAD